MIRSFRAAVANESKASRKRRWSSLKRSSKFYYGLPPPRQVILTGKNYLHPRGLCFFSTNPNKKEPLPQPILKQLQSLPNLITLSRMASTPFLCYWVIQEEYKLAIFGCVLAGASDFIDGYLAKNYDGCTVLGTYLDPLSDKILINGLAISLWYSGILPIPLIMAWASKDLLLLGGMGWYLYKEQHTINFFHNSVATRPLTVTPSILGKVNTGLQFATLGAGILTPLLPEYILQPVILQSLCWVTGVTSIVTVISYAGRSGFKTTEKIITDKKSTSTNDGAKV